ncbi:F-box/LRR-repeat protein at3g48880 [Phtheirospermum japonicum]|uniref:F-box/LRR-repeat protein at3g48880 n=1 Tax=Phtheirospermum japonicum TaxID=374723 RepID=A0A830BQH5_9LAMI|nr:F-box/LRR-repeat protein at3g48880 [Phtheirospermum japonicum]
MNHHSAWDTLPNLALANIFCRTSIKDRSNNIPFVCRSWAHAVSHPHCWASMVAQNHSPFGNPAADHAFVMDSNPNGAAFVDPFDGRRSPCPHRGVASLQGLIGRAGAGAGAVVTSIYFFPFLTSAGGPANDDALLRIIAKHCPNLKHLSFHGSHNASQEAILEVIHSCTKLELIDFSDSPYFNSLILGELSCSCPNIRGIRRNGYLEPLFSNSLITGFPRLKILNISNSTVVDKDLLAIVTGFKDLCYLDVTGCQQLMCYMHIIKVASARIANIFKSDAEDAKSGEMKWMMVLFSMFDVDSADWYQSEGELTQWNLQQGDDELGWWALSGSVACFVADYGSDDGGSNQFWWFALLTNFGYTVNLKKLAGGN